ncbi:MAG: hypothetical protein WD801_16510 [Gemmatimonadaceae bacterium]
MLRLLFWLSAGLCGLLGFIHTGVTFVAYRTLSPGSIWFAGTGLSMLLLTIVNVAAWRASSGDRFLRYGAIAANLSMSALGFFAVKAVPEPQAYAVLAAFIGLLVSSLPRAPFWATADEQHESAT